ncbi:MAG: ACT domain-containing protein [Lachnospiraceae bacterium]|nr:ACT domain-containing protein [Lachnospiraceae bacterium]MDY5741573.1 ACT domain-containing protein [Lachnospiraceae bacterium]
MNKAVITVVGKDTVGIIAAVCSFLAEKRINILDISQTIVRGYFNMMMIVDTTAAQDSFSTVQEGLQQVGEGLGVSIHCQKAEIFEKMHRI